MAGRLTLLALVDKLYAVLEELARDVNEALDVVCHCDGGAALCVRVS